MWYVSCNKWINNDYFYMISNLNSKNGIDWTQNGKFVLN